MYPVLSLLNPGKSWHLRVEVDNVRDSFKLEYTKEMSCEEEKLLMRANVSESMSNLKVIK